MSKITILALVAALAAMSASWLRSPGAHEAEDPPQAVSVAAEATEPRSTESAAAHPAPRQAPPESALSSARLDLDRAPWSPKLEVKQRYMYRKRIVDAFDEFLEQSGISDERAQEILQILHDFQVHALSFGRVQREHEAPDTHAADHTMLPPMDNYRTMQARLDELLSSAEQNVWARTMAPTHFARHLEYQRIIKPAPP